MIHLPQQFLKRMQERLGEEYPAFLASYENTPYKGLRVNTLKISVEDFLTRAPFPLGEQVLEEYRGFYHTEEKAGADVYHFAGLYYLQEPSAMCISELTDACKKERVLDLCAAPGGKSTLVAAQMEGDGILIANEIDGARAKILSQNVERMGVTNCAVTNASPKQLAEKFPEYFDMILVDAPCSGEGMFKKEPNAVPEWSEQNVAMCAARQREILDYASTMLAGGGHIVYSTCTFAEEEDEWQIEDFLKRHPEFELCEQEKLYPHKFKGEGHFCALLEKREPLIPREPTPSFRGRSPSESLSGGNQAVSLPEQDTLSSLRSVTSPLARVAFGVRYEAAPKPYPIKRNAAAEKAYKAFAEDFFAPPSCHSEPLLCHPESSSCHSERSEESSTQATEKILRRFAPQNDNRSFLSGEITTLPDGRMYLVPAGVPALDVRVLRLGVELGEWDGKVFKPAHALAMALGKGAKRKVKLSREEAKKYLHGETLEADIPNGWCVVCVEEFPLGLGKAVNGIIKNHLPKGLRMVK